MEVGVAKVRILNFILSPNDLLKIAFKIPFLHSLQMFMYPIELGRTISAKKLNTSILN